MDGLAPGPLLSQPLSLKWDGCSQNSLFPDQGGEPSSQVLLTFEMSDVGEGQNEATLGGAGVPKKEDPGPAVGEAW